MNSKQQADTGMFKRLKTRVDATSLVIRNGILHFEPAYTSFLAKQVKISDYFDAQMMDRKGIRKNKTIIRNTLTENILDFGAKTESYAAFIGDNELLEKVNYTRTELVNFTEQEFIAAANIISSVVTTHAAALVAYGLTAIMITDFDTLKASFVTITPLPKSGIDEKKAATKLIKTTLIEAHDLLLTMDRAVRANKLTYPEFHDEYFIAREVEDPITHNLAAKGTLVDLDGMPVPFAKMTCSTLNIKRKLNGKGTFQISGIINGPHKITFVQPDFKTVVYDAVFVSGKRIQIDIVMDPQ